MTLSRVSLALLAVLVLAVPAQSQDTDFDVWIDDVQLRPGVTIDLHATVFVNEEHPCHDKTIVAVPGFTASSGFFEPLAEALFDDNPTGRKVCRFAVIDLPGHPGPPWVGNAMPEGDLLLGEFTLQDHVTGYLAALAGLHEAGIHPKTVLGHSMGGIVVQMAQQRLIDQGTNLRKAFNTKKAVLVAPVRAAPVPLPEFADVKELFDLLYAEVISYAELDFLMFPYFLAWDCDPWTSPIGIPPLPAPADCDPVSGLGDLYLYFGLPAMREPMTVGLQMFDALQYERPAVEPGIFGPRYRTELWVVSLEHDTTLWPENTPPLYRYLTGENGLDRYWEVVGPNAEHNMPYFSPVEFLNGIAGVVELP